MHPQNRLVFLGDDTPTGFFSRLESLFTAGRFPDADGSRQGFRVIDRMAEHQWSGAGGLDAQDPGQSRVIQLVVLLEAHPVSGNIAGVAHRQTKPIRRAA